MLQMCGHVNHVLLPMSHCVCGDAVVWKLQIIWEVLTKSESIMFWAKQLILYHAITYKTPKTESRHDACNFGGIAGCHNDNLLCR